VIQGEEGSGTLTPTTAPAVAEDLDFLDPKKKKKTTKKKTAFDLEAFEKELNETQSKEVNEDGDDGTHLADVDEAELGDNPFARAESQPTGMDSGNEPWLKSDRDYTYPEVCSYAFNQRKTVIYTSHAKLLNRFYASLHASNPALLNSAGKRYTIAPPSIHREGNKKTIFANVTDICKRMHRQPEHVIQFLFAEMGTTGSVDGAGRLIIKGRFQQKQVENVLRRYIGNSPPFYYRQGLTILCQRPVEYVTCKTCKSPDTLLTKENRIFFMSCESCGSRRSVNAIKTGYQAQVGRRSRNQTG
jgi:translation initiation factor 2 subunit 2